MAFPTTKTPPKTIAQTTEGTPKLKTFHKAVKAAGLIPTLDGKGPYTVFAPTDAAFEKLGATTLDSLLKPESKDKLAGILRHHVCSGNHPAADVKKLKEIAVMDGKKLKVTTKGDAVMIESANVVTPDLKASNGLVHMIDAVLTVK